MAKKLKKLEPPVVPFAKLEEEDFLFRDIFEEGSYRQQVKSELQEASNVIRSFAESAEALRHRQLQLGKSWDVAKDLVTSFQPVPRFLWSGIRGVLCNELHEDDVHPLAFSALRSLIFHAADDRTLGDGEGPGVDLTATVEILGKDVVAALCLIHAVVRKIANRLPEQVWQPLLDDALLRAQIGYYVGRNAPKFGCGRGMLAGFSGRSGLALQIASGDLSSAQKAVSQLSNGSDINEVGFDVYGCDPLQVAAMTLVAAGCGRGAALGTACYSWSHETIESGSDEFSWLSAFALVENLRLGHSERVPAEQWQAMNITGEKKIGLWNELARLKRLGTSWRWLTQPHYALGLADPSKRPAAVEQ